MFAIPGKQAVTITEAAARQIARLMAKDGHKGLRIGVKKGGQVVIAGQAGAVEQAMGYCKEAGAKRALPLPVSAPFHTSLMRPAADQLAAFIESTTFHAPTIPIVHNVHAKTEVDPEVIKQLMIEQIYQPVLWVDCVQTLAAKGINQLVECGPGAVLAGLAKRIDKSLQAVTTGSVDEFNKAMAEVTAG